MPNKPNWLQTIQFVKYFFTKHCEFPWIVYFETAKPAVGNMILTLISFGMEDVIRGLFRPKGLRSKRHGRKGRKNRKIKKGFIPELGETVASKVPGAENVRARKVSDGVKHLWLIDGFIQKVAYHWMMIDVLNDFTYEWLSGIMADPRTKCDGVMRCMSHGGPDEVLSGHGEWIPIVLPDEDYRIGSCFISSHQWFVPAGNWQVCISTEVFNGVGDPTQVFVSVVQYKGAEWDFNDVSEHTVSVGDTDGFISSAFIVGPASGFFGFKSTNDFVTLPKPVGYCQQIGD